MAGNAIDLVAKIDPQEAREVCIEVLRSPDGAETTSIRYLRSGGAVKTKGPETFHDTLGVSLRAQGSDALLCSLDVWQMKNIWTAQ